MFRWLALVVLAGGRRGGRPVRRGRTRCAAVDRDYPSDKLDRSGQHARGDGRRARRAARRRSSVTLEQNGTRIPALLARRAPNRAVDRHDRADRCRSPARLAAVRQAEHSGAAVRRRPPRGHGEPPVVPDPAHAVRARCQRDLQVRLEPPRLCGRVDASLRQPRRRGDGRLPRRRRPTSISGVRVGDVEYPGYPASGAGMAGGDPSRLKVAFFALLHDQDLATPIVVFARDEAGNEATRVVCRQGLREAVPAKPHRDRRPVRPAGRARRSSRTRRSSACRRPRANLLPAFLKINGDLRQLQRRPDRRR